MEIIKKLSLSQKLEINNVYSYLKKEELNLVFFNAHEGKISKVFKYIDAISKTGVDAIKFQTHIAEEESTLDEPFRKISISKLKTGLITGKV